MIAHLFSFGKSKNKTMLKSVSILVFFPIYISIRIVYDNREQSKIFRVKCRRDGELYGGRRWIRTTDQTQTVFPVCIVLKCVLVPDGQQPTYGLGLFSRSVPGNPSLPSASDSYQRLRWKICTRCCIQVVNLLYVASILGWVNGCIGSACPTGISINFAPHPSLAAGAFLLECWPGTMRT